MTRKQTKLIQDLLENSFDNITMIINGKIFNNCLMDDVYNNILEFLIEEIELGGTTPKNLKNKVKKIIERRKLENGS